jgi:hypothetical protein
MVALKTLASQGFFAVASIASGSTWDVSLDLWRVKGGGLWSLAATLTFAASEQDRVDALQSTAKVQAGRDRIGN